MEKVKRNQYIIIGLLIIIIYGGIRNNQMLNKK
jgi:hypothetical protein